MPGEAGGLANDEAGVDFADCFDGGAYRLEARQEIVDGFIGEIFAGHANGGERRDSVFGEMDVVETDEGEVVGDFKPGLEERVLNADGGHVVRAHDGGWARG